MPPEQAPPLPPEHHQAKYLFVTLGILVILIGLLASSYYLTRTPEQTQEQEDSLPLILSEVEGWQTYRNDEYGFEFRYPESFYFSPTKDVGPIETLIGADTIIYIFLNPEFGTSVNNREIVIGNYSFMENDYSFEIMLSNKSVLSFQFDPENADTEVKHILSTFRFIETSVTTTGIIT